MITLDYFNDTAMRVAGNLESRDHKHLATLADATRRQDWWLVSASEQNFALLMRMFAKRPMLIDNQLASLVAEPRTYTNVFDADLAPIPLTKTTPWQHQLQAFHFCSERDGALLDIVCGGGKTKIACDVAQNIDGARRVLIITVAKMVDEWPHEIERHIGDHVIVCAPALNQSVKKRAEQVADALTNEAPVYVVINHDAAWRSPMAELLLAHTWDVVIVDESHKLNDVKTKLNKFCVSLAPRAKKRLCLSGTPYGQEPLNVFGQALFLDSTVFGTNYFSFADKFGVFREMDVQNGTKYVTIQKFVKLRNEEEFAERCNRFMLHIGNEVLDLPDATHTRRYYQLDDFAQGTYKKLAKEFFAEMDGGNVVAVNGGVKLLRLQQITSGFVTNEHGDEITIDTGKRALLLDTLNDYPSDEPIVVIARFHHDLDVIADVAREAGRIAGEVSGRRDDLAAFKSGQCNLLAVQIQAGGAGVSLVRASVCIYFSVGRSLIDYTQSLARVQRPGQTRNVQYVYLHASRTVDDTVFDALQSRQDVIDYLYAQRRRVLKLSA